jgi:hypothetical protein
MLLLLLPPSAALLLLVLLAKPASLMLLVLLPPSAALLLLKLPEGGWPGGWGSSSPMRFAVRQDSRSCSTRWGSRQCLRETEIEMGWDGVERKGRFKEVEQWRIRHFFIYYHLI